MIGIYSIEYTADICKLYVNNMHNIIIIIMKIVYNSKLQVATEGIKREELGLALTSRTIDQ